MNSINIENLKNRKVQINIQRVDQLTVSLLTGVVAVCFPITD